MQPLKNQILQKDLSFSNQIFKKTFNIDNTMSNKSSQQNFGKNTIPPLVKYTDQNIPKQLEQNYQTKQGTVKDNRNKVVLNFFQKSNNNLRNNFNVQNENENQQTRVILPLSQMEEIIMKKYKKNQASRRGQFQDLSKQIPRQDYNNSKNDQHINSKNKSSSKPTTVHFDKTQQLEQKNSTSQENTQQFLIIDSLEQSRIANQSIQKQNNWVLDNLDDNSQSFAEGQTLLRNMQNDKKNEEANDKKALIKKDPRKINPLSLVFNSLHNSNLPEFVDDDQPIGKQINQHEIKSNINEIQQNYISRGKQGQIKGNVAGKSKLINANNDRNTSQNNSERLKGSAKKQKKATDLTLQLYKHYVGSFYQKHSDQNAEKDSLPNSMIINQLEQDNYGFDKYTTKSSPVKHYEKSSPMHQNYRQISENQQTQAIRQELSQNENDQKKRYQDKSRFTVNQNFIRDRTSKQIIGTVLTDNKKMKMYLKYLQCQISENVQNSSLSQNYSLLSCTLLKIQQITSSNQKEDKPKALAHSLIQLFSQKKNFGSKDSQLKSFKPQIIRSNNKIKIDFDPYLKYQRCVLNDRISYLKKCIEQKNKQTQLIKLTYDGIVHNYAESLENLAKKAENNQHDKQRLLQVQQEPSVYSRSQNKSIFSEKVQGKAHLDVSDILSRGSLQGNKIHRKATFGKVPSSFRGSGAML